MLSESESRGEEKERKRERTRVVLAHTHDLYDSLNICKGSSSRNSAKYFKEGNNHGMASDIWKFIFIFTIKK